jgi:tetratricopeptide (TPR) repeat protein
MANSGRPSPHASGAARAPGRAASARARAGARRPDAGRSRPPAPAVPTPAAPLLRDPWAAAPLLAALVLAAHAWFSHIGEPVLDDFDFLHHAASSAPGGWLDGGGSHFYWRPLARQAYYRLLGGLLLAHPAWGAALETAFAALAGLLLYRALRSRWPAHWAAAAATFPLLIEAARPLIADATNFQDLGAILFSALALHEASRSRLWSALVALIAALLCKEVAVVTALLVPWMPGTPGLRGVERHVRWRWTRASGLVVAAWGAAYALVVQRAGLLLARDAAADPRAIATPWLERFFWACGQSARDTMNLPALVPPLRTAAGLVLAAIAGWALVVFVASPAARARLRAAGPWVAWGLAWFALSNATLADVYPDWRPYRTPFSALGLGVACTALLGAVKPALLAALVVARVATFALSPGPPAAIAADISARYSLDFPRLAQLQRLVGETRRELLRALPPPARDVRVAAHFYPRSALLAFTGNRSLEAWYRDTTARWVTLDGADPPGLAVGSVVLEFQPTPPRQVVTVSREALRHLEQANRLIERKEWARVLEEAARAESLESDPDARLFASLVAGKRALALGALGRDAAAFEQGARAIALWSGNDDARYELALVWLRRGRLREAEGALDTMLAAHPGDPALRKLLVDTRRARLAREP